MAGYRSDPSLVQACLKGSEGAWNELVDRYGRLVYSVPRRLGLSDSDAEDVMQAVFTALFQHLDRLQDRTRVSAWLITAAHRESWRVGKSRGAVASFDERMPDVSAPPDDQLERWELQDQVRRGVDELGGRCARLLHLLYLGRAEPDYQAIATALSMPIGSIGPTRARCLKKLEALLHQHGVRLEPRMIERGVNGDGV